MNSSYFLVHCIGLTNYYISIKSDTNDKLNYVNICRTVVKLYMSTCKTLHGLVANATQKFSTR